MMSCVKCPEINSCWQQRGFAAKFLCAVCENDEGRGRQTAVIETGVKLAAILQFVMRLAKKLSILLFVTLLSVLLMLSQIQKGRT